MHTFPEKIKHAREIRGWSQARMAEELETTPNRISTWERGVALPSAYFREKLCTLLQIDAQELGLLPDRQEVTPVLTPISPIPVSPGIPTPQKAISKKYIFLVFLLACLLSISACCVYLWLKPLAYNPYTANTAQLVLDEVLNKQDPHFNWQEGTNATQAFCAFRHEGYVAYQPRVGFFHACIAQNTNYENFAFEVAMTIRSGEFGGLVFRSENGIDAHYYLFRIHVNGTYKLYRFVNNSIADAVLLDQGKYATFHSGIGTSNLLAIVAQNNQFTVFINRKQLTTVRDASYTHGQIGVLAGGLTVHPAEALFTHARVWTW